MKKLLMVVLLVFGLNAFGISPIANSTQFTEQDMIKQKWNWFLPIHIVNNGTSGDAAIYFNYKKAKKGVPKITLDIQTKNGYKEIEITEWPLTLKTIREAGVKAGVEFDFQIDAVTETSISPANSDIGIVIQFLSNGVLKEINENEPLNINKIYQGMIIR